MGGDLKEKRKNMQQYEPRLDGVTNTLTTVLKDNLIVCKVTKHEAYRCKAGNG